MSSADVALRRIWRGVLPAMMAVVLAAGGCAYRGGTDEPVVRRASWFSYLDGGDLRESCGPGAVDRYRLVYNGRYTEQLRSYEITADGMGGGLLVARALNQTNLMELRLDDLQAPWRWKRSEARLAPAEMEALVDALAADGLFGPPPDGLRLRSWEFYWVASACRAGRFHFSAWTQTGDLWNELAFPALLFARDETGVAVNPPWKISAGERFGTRGGKGERGSELRFTLQVDGDGLGGISALGW